MTTEVEANPRWRADAPCPATVDDLMPVAAVSAAADILAALPGYQATPMLRLDGLARALGVGEIHYKDEGRRFAAAGLGSFKATGAPVALCRALAERLAVSGRRPSAADLVAGREASAVANLVAVAATDGNHGRALAWAAERFGCACRIYIGTAVSEARAASIARYGAEIVRVRGTYDDAVRQAAEDAARHGWLEISDTARDGYDVPPRDIMQGYAAMAEEAAAALDRPPTHVFLQAGVGGFAAGVAGQFWRRWGADRPRPVVVEPVHAACFLASARAGRPSAVGGALDTIMAGLACGVPSTIAWDIVTDAAFAFMAVEDRWAIEAMRRLAANDDVEGGIVAGESGAAGLAALIALHDRPADFRALGLGRDSRVLLFGTEGATDPELYSKLVG